MRRTIFFVVICLLASDLPAQMESDSAFVRFSGDTVKICHINFWANCAAKNISTAEIRSDTIIVVESDTSRVRVNCICMYDITTSLTGLNPGNYIVIIYRSTRNISPDGFDTLQTRWKLPLRIARGGPVASASYSSSGCHPGTTPAWTPAVFPLHVGNVWEYTEDLSYKHQTLIERDTLMPNGHRYAVLMSNQWVAGYLRQQGDTVFQYILADSSEQIVYDFSRAPGDTVIYRIGASNDTTILVVASVGTMQLFGRNLRYWTFYRDIRPYIDDELTFTVVDSIGLYELRPGFGPWDVLTGAKIDGRVYGVITAVDEQARIPRACALLGNYPNPFNPVTVIQYTVGGTEGRGARVTLAVYDLLGREVAVLVNEPRVPGTYEVRFDGSGYASGVYLYQLSVEGFIQTKTMMLVK